MRDNGIFYEDVEVGNEIPPLVKKPGNADIFMFSAITWNIHRIHYDVEFARDHDKLPDVVVQRTLHGCYLAQLLTDWIGVDGTLKKLGWSNRGMAVPGDTLACRGKVTGKYVKDGENYIECEVWIENQQGERITPGSATVVLPSKAG